jgi:pseudaminic acid biosynthesis-associated methylase
MTGKMQLQTEQEAFWQGEFGDEYVKRNSGQHLIASNAANFAKIFARTGPPKSLIEFGANIGNNLRAINFLSPHTALSAIELNQSAVAQLRTWGKCTVHEGSMLEFESGEKWEMTLIKGVLVHINPDRLKDVYRKLYERSTKYVCISEYYNQKPVEIDYRGHSGKLFKRDFAGEMLDLYPDLKLVDYGFVYHRDLAFPSDDSTWFLMEKR